MVAAYIRVDLLSYIYLEGLMKIKNVHFNSVRSAKNLKYLFI